MILSPHIITGAALGANFSPEGWRIFVLPIIAMILHHSLDLTPHYDYKLKPLSFIVALKVFLDIIIGASTIIIIYLFFNPQINIWTTASGAFFGTLPDGLLLLSFIFPNKLLLKYQRLHNSLHFNNKQIDTTTGLEIKKPANILSIATQLIAIIIAIIFLL